MPAGDRPAGIYMELSASLACGLRRRTPLTIPCPTAIPRHCYARSLPSSTPIRRCRRRAVVIPALGVFPA